MLTKFWRKLSPSIFINSNTSQILPNSWPQFRLQVRRRLHERKRSRALNPEKQKVIPRLVYLHDPYKFVFTKWNLLKFRLFWDPEFVESEFTRGAKQAAVVLTHIIRTQNGAQVKQFTTPVGCQQITRDMFLSRDDNRLRLVRFEAEHLRRAIPVNVATRETHGHRYCFIDMLFVGLRNTKDFDSLEETVEIRKILEKLDADLKTPFEVFSAPHRIVFAEILIRFRRDYTEYPANNTDTDWSVSFYKILTFDILNYEPKY